MKILFLHGWHSVPGGVKPAYLHDHGHEVINPKLPDDDFAEAVRTAQAEFDQHRPQVVVGSSRGGGLHTLLWVQRIFPGHFKNFVFVNARTVDVKAYGGDHILEKLKGDAEASLGYFERFCHVNGLAAKSYAAYGTDPVEEIVHQAEKIRSEFSNAIFFTSKLIFEDENWVTRILHNQAALALQRRLHLGGMQMVILGMKV